MKLSHNKITELPNLTTFPLTYQIEVDVSYNPINCTCSILQVYVQRFDHNNANVTLSCSADNKLANNSMNNNIKVINLNDFVALDCLIGSEGKDSISSTENGQSENNDRTDYIQVTGNNIKNDITDSAESNKDNSSSNTNYQH